MGGGGMMGGMGGGMMGGGMFAVEDDLKLGTKKAAAAKLPAVRQARQLQLGRVRRPPRLKAAKRIDVQPAAGESLADAWDRYFAEQKSRLAQARRASRQPRRWPSRWPAVRETVRQLMHEKKYGEVPTLIQAALRHGQVESWMYEALALAMRADAEDKQQPVDTDELERALLSAVDFAQNEDQVLMIAAYMAQVGPATSGP